MERAGLDDGGEPSSVWGKGKQAAMIEFLVQAPDFPASPDVPPANAPSRPTPSDQRLAVRQENEGADGPVVTHKLALRLPRAHIPQADIRVPRGKRLAIRTEGNSRRAAIALNLPKLITRAISQSRSTAL